MKVLHVIDNFAQGGAQRVAVSIAEGFPGSAIVSFDRLALLAFPEHLKKHGITHQFVNTEAEVDDLMRDFDVCHIHWWKCPIDERLTWHDKPYPVVVTIHEASVFPHRGITTLVCVGTKQQSIQVQPSVVIPNGFDLDKFVYRRDYEAKDGILRVGFASRLDSKLELNCGSYYKIALARVTQPYEVIIIGDGGYRGHYERTFQEETKLPAVFTGLRWDMEIALRDLDIFLYPTKADVLPTVVIEAMASGLPVVAPPVGAIPEMLADGRGFAVPWDEMPGVLAMLAESNLRQKMGSKAQKFALKTYGHQQMIDNYRALYESMLKVKQRIILGSKPRLSVIVPTYKRPGLCLQTVKSLLAQDYPNLEVIVVNDADHASDYSAVSKLPITYIELKKNVGLSGARNAGVERATGELLGFLDDDDKWLPYFASSLVTWLAQDRADVVYGAGYATAGNGERHNMHHCEPFDLARLCKTNYITVSAVVMRKDVFLNTGGFDVAMHQDGMHGPEDWEMWLRLAHKGYKLARCPVVGLVYGIDSPDRLTGIAYQTGAMKRGYDYISKKLGVTVG